MTSTTDRGASPTIRKAPSPVSRHERLEGLLAQTGRRVVPIRRTLVQQGHGADTMPGPLAKFLTAHDDRALEAYLLIHAMASAEPWNIRLPSDAWISALGLDKTATKDSAKTAVSKIMGRLEKRQLIRRERSKRLSDVILLKEDGSGDPFERPRGDRPEDRWLQLPHAYWLERHYETLRLPAKVMLLVALSLPDRFWLPYEYAPNWYGISPDSAEEGLRELRNADLLDVDQNWVKAPRSETGWTLQLLYTLQGSFSQAERMKAARSRSQAATVADDETVIEPIASVVPMPTVKKICPA